MVPVITLEAVRNKRMTMMTARDGRNHVDDVIHMEFGAVRFILPQSQPENDNDNDNNTDDNHENHDHDDDGGDDIHDCNKNTKHCQNKKSRTGGKRCHGKGSFMKEFYLRDMTRIYCHIFHHSRRVTTMPRTSQMTKRRTAAVTALAGMARIHHRAGATNFKCLNMK